jgi:hypothetical protein
MADPDDTMEDGACPERLETPGGWAGIGGSVSQFPRAVNRVPAEVVAWQKFALFKLRAAGFELRAALNRESRLRLFRTA